MYTIEPLRRDKASEVIEMLQGHFIDRGDIRYSIGVSLGNKSTRHTSWKRKNRIAGCHYWTLHLANTLVGVVGYYQKYGEGNCFWLGWFYVKPKYRKCGFGKVLLSSIIALARHKKVKFIRLYTGTEKGQKTPSIYSRFGFEIYQSTRAVGGHIHYLELNLERGAE